MFTSTKTNLRNLQKQFNALYHTPLVTTTNAMFCGVPTNKILLNTPPMSYPSYWKGFAWEQPSTGIENLFSEYASLTVAPKLAPCLHSQRNKSLGGTINSKNLKVWHYEGSEISDFTTACGVAQHNEGHNFIRETLMKTKIWFYQMRTKFGLSNENARNVFVSYRRSTTVSSETTRSIN